MIGTTILAPCPDFSKETLAQVQRLLGLANAGLAQMFDEQTKLFYFRLKESSHGLLKEGHSPRYSIITLLGLHRLQASGTRPSVEIMPVIEALLRDTEWIDNIGDLGLLLWLSANVDPQRLTTVSARLDVQNALASYTDAQRGQTMELAWFLTGLCYWAQARPDVLPAIRRTTLEVYERLKNNQGSHGIFRHSARTGSLVGRTRGWIGSFADQVYPIYAMALLAEVHGIRDAEERALQCGRAICEAQGLKGQWWWHYDSSTGHVIDGYPVFSVHQHGMAPMALFALSDLAKKDFSSCIARGLKWIAGENELEFDMENSQRTIVWRCIYRASSPLRPYVNAVLRRPSLDPTARGRTLKVLFECRPYEMGWLLYAFAGRLINASATESSDSLLTGARR